MIFDPEDSIEADADPTDDKDIKCPTCGDGEEVECPECYGDGITEDGQECELCQGDCWIDCPECNEQ